jgi:hypothetical protein
MLAENPDYCRFLLLFPFFPPPLFFTDEEGARVRLKLLLSKLILDYFALLRHLQVVHFVKLQLQAG